MFERHKRETSQTNSFMPFFFLDGKHREPQSINAKLFLPIIPIGIVAYALTLLWDNLCRNSCIHKEKESQRQYFNCLWEYSINYLGNYLIP